mmetsp:Transcript_87740/g.271688  ORF Transcript_87740/g.271688 Transcript_87740/m.271688 type:complete len:552 (-) Transcript_87740:72-1727(-)
MDFLCRPPPPHRPQRPAGLRESGPKEAPPASLRALLGGGGLPRARAQNGPLRQARRVAATAPPSGPPPPGSARGAPRRSDHEGRCGRGGRRVRAAGVDPTHDDGGVRHALLQGGEGGAGGGHALLEARGLEPPGGVAHRLGRGLAATAVVRDDEAVVVLPHERPEDLPPGRVDVLGEVCELARLLLRRRTPQGRRERISLRLQLRLRCANVHNGLREHGAAGPVAHGAGGPEEAPAVHTQRDVHGERPGHGSGRTGPGGREDGGMRSVRGEPDDAGAVRRADVHDGVVAAVDGDGAFPCACRDAGLLGPGGDAERRVEGPRGHRVRHEAELGALVVVAVDADDVRRGDRPVRPHRERVAGLGRRDLQARVQLQRGREEAVGAPEPAGAVVRVAVLAEREGPREVKHAPPVPETELLRDGQGVGGDGKVVRVSQVHGADDEAVGHDRNLAVRHAPRGPDGRAARGVGQEVEDPGLRWVGKDERLAPGVHPEVLSVEAAAMLGKVPHEPDRAARRLAALQRQQGELLVREEGRAVVRQRLGRDPGAAGALAEG